MNSALVTIYRLVFALQIWDMQMRETQALSVLLLRSLHYQYLSFCAFPLFQLGIYTSFTSLYASLLNTEFPLIILSFIFFLSDWFLYQANLMHHLCSEKIPSSQTSLSIWKNDLAFIVFLFNMIFLHRNKKNKLKVGWKHTDSLLLIEK